MEKPKIYTWYLPQFHCIPENDAFWGKGFTDWETVKRAKPLYKNHHQPKVPLDGEYYDLSKVEAIKAQARMARENGVAGFGIYHYWFNTEKNLLTRPAEIILENPDIDIEYFFAWDNASWKRSWSNVYGNDWAPVADQGIQHRSGSGILIPYILGDKPEWEIHFNALKPYFADPRYLKEANKPVFVILQYDAEIAKMCEYWDELAKKEGYAGMSFIYKFSEQTRSLRETRRFVYEPIFSGWSSLPKIKLIWDKLLRILFQHNNMHVYTYDAVWKRILRNAQKNSDSSVLFGGFVGYDDTPRRGLRGTLVRGASPAKFEKYMRQLIDLCARQGKPWLFLTAWNEWGEGAYLEPDNEFGGQYLDVVKRLTNTKLHESVV